MPALSEAYIMGAEAGRRKLQADREFEFRKQSHAEEEVDRKLRIKMLQLAAKQHQLEGEIKARQLAVEEAQRLEGLGQGGQAVSIPGVSGMDGQQVLAPSSFTTRGPEEIARVKEMMSAAEAGGKKQPLDPALSQFLHQHGIDAGGEMFPQQYQALLTALSAQDRNAAVDARAQAAGARAEAGTLTPLVAPDGRVLGAFNNKTGQIVPVPNAEGLGKTAVPSGEQDKRVQISNMIEDLGTLDTIVARGGDKLIGPVVGRLSKMQSATTGGSQDQVDLERITTNIADQLLRARSGAAITEGEYVRLAKLVPQITDPLPTFKAKLKSFRSELERAQSKRTPAAGSGSGTGAAPATGGDKKRLKFNPETGDFE